MRKGLKLFCMILAVMFLMSSIVGCESKNNSSDDNSSTSAATTASTTTNTDTSSNSKTDTGKAKTDVTFWCIDWGGKVTKLLNKIVDDFNKQSDSVRVKLQIQTPEGGITGFDNKVQPAIVAGTAPDIVTVNIAHEGIDKGFLEYVDDYVVDDDKFSWSKYYPFEVNKITYKGKKAAVPFMVDLCGVLMYNKTMFKEAGLDPDKTPTTIAELDAMAEKLTKRDDQGNYTQVGLLPWEWMFEEQSLTLAAIFGAKLVDENGVPTPLNPDLIKAYEWVVSYANKYGYEKVNATIPKSLGFQQGKIAMTYAYNGDVNMLYNQKVSFEWGLAPFPTAKEGLDPTWVGGWMLGIVKGSKHPKEAGDFLKYICGDEGQKTYLSEIDQGVGFSFSPLPTVNEFLYDKMNWAQQFFVTNALPTVSEHPQFHIKEDISKKYREARVAMFSGKSELKSTMENLDRYFKSDEFLKK